MLNKIVFLITFLTSLAATAQELNATVTVNSQKIQQSNKQIFTSLQNGMRDFLNNTKFTNLNVNRQELIDCNVLLIVDKYDPGTNSFVGSLQIQSSRPIFGTSYNTTVFNFNDRNINFNYIELEPLVYSESSISSNLVGILSFYAHYMIGLDQDTFALYSGTQNYQKASNVVSLMQSNGDKGWVMGDASNRYALANDLLSNTFEPYRQALYDYHMKGLDTMETDPAQAKIAIANAINTLANIHRTRPNALPTRMFFDAKTDEIVKVFGAGPNYDANDLIETLTKISPMNGAKWNRM